MILFLAKDIYMHNRLLSRRRAKLLTLVNFGHGVMSINVLIYLPVFSIFSTVNIIAIIVF